MRTVSATESEIQREGVLAILLKAGLDIERVSWTQKRDCKTGEWIYTWTEEAQTTQRR